MGGLTGDFNEDARVLSAFEKTLQHLSFFIEAMNTVTRRRKKVKTRNEPPILFFPFIFVLFLVGRMPDQAGAVSRTEASSSISRKNTPHRPWHGDEAQIALRAVLTGSPNFFYFSVSCYIEGFSRHTLPHGEDREHDINPASSTVEITH